MRPGPDNVPSLYLLSLLAASYTRMFRQFLPNWQFLANFVIEISAKTGWKGAFYKLAKFSFEWRAVEERSLATSQVGGRLTKPPSPSLSINLWNLFSNPRIFSSSWIGRKKQGDQNKKNCQNHHIYASNCLWPWFICLIVLWPHFYVKKIMELSVKMANEQ